MARECNTECGIERGNNRIIQKGLKLHKERKGLKKWEDRFDSNLCSTVQQYFRRIINYLL